MNCISLHIETEALLCFTELRRWQCLVEIESEPSEPDPGTASHWRAESAGKTCCLGGRTYPVDAEKSLSLCCPTASSSAALSVYLMVRSEVVHLPPEHLCPEVFANELHDVQLVLETRGVTSQSEYRHNLKHILKTDKINKHIFCFAEHCYLSMSPWPTRKPIPSRTDTQTARSWGLLEIIIIIIKTFAHFLPVSRCNVPCKLSRVCLILLWSFY